jgi:hypothetical protein
MNKISTSEKLGGAILVAAAMSGLAAGCADDREVFVTDNATSTTATGQGGQGGSAGEAGNGGEAGQGGSETCTGLETKCGSKCVDVYTDADNCGACGHICDGVKDACYNATCECAGGKTECDSECVDTTSDPDNCGACEIVCDSTEHCEESYCK